jgi:hypothetical protein
MKKIILACLSVMLIGAVYASPVTAATTTAPTQAVTMTPADHSGSQVQIQDSTAVSANAVAPAASADMPKTEKVCKKGKACGDTCIAKDKTCSIKAHKAPNCKKGKACGDSCIAKDKTCHVK